MTGFESALTIGGTLISAMGAIKQGQAASAAATFNAKKAQYQAKGEIAAASESAKRQRRLARKREGQLVVRGAGVDLLEDQAMEEALEIATIKHGGQVRAQGFSNTASLNLLRAGTASKEGMFGAGAILLQGGAKARRSYRAGD